MMYAVSITVDDVVDALADFIEPFCGASEIIRAQVNRTPMPHGPFVVLTELMAQDIETPLTEYDGQQDIASITGPARIDVQIDFYGPNAGNQCKAVKNVYRTEYAASQFPDGIKPLYCSDGIQSPLITGEQQWESRWTLTASLQFNPVVEVPQEFADELEVNQTTQADSAQ
jgi:hypothetical protein